MSNKSTKNTLQRETPKSTIANSSWLSEFPEGAHSVSEPYPTGIPKGEERGTARRQTQDTKVESSPLTSAPLNVYLYCFFEGG